MRPCGAGAAAQAEAVMAIAAGASTAKMMLRIGHSSSLNVTFLSSACASVRAEIGKHKLHAGGTVLHLMLACHRVRTQMSNSKAPLEAKTYGRLLKERSRPWPHGEPGAPRHARHEDQLSENTQPYPEPVEG